MDETYLEWMFDTLKRLGEGIASVVGPNCEVIVHDFRDLEHTVIAVAGDLTHRQPGAPVPDLNFVSEGQENGADLMNYRTTIEGRDLQSSTIWLRDLTGDPIGAVCVNVDYSGLIEARDLIDGAISSVRFMSDLYIKDTFARNVDELIENSVRGFIQQETLPGLETMSLDEKLRLVQHLESRGLFQIRGSVQKVAELLNVSRASIYNYRVEVASGERSMI